MDTKTVFPHKVSKDGDYLFCTIKGSVMKYDAFRLMSNTFFVFLKTFALIFLVFSSKYPYLKLEMFTRFWILVLSRFVAPSSDH